MYWYGSPHLSTGANLATCIWTSRKAAIEASKWPLISKRLLTLPPVTRGTTWYDITVVKRLNEIESASRRGRAMTINGETTIVVRKIDNVQIQFCKGKIVWDRERFVSV